MQKQEPETVIISILDKSGKKDLSILSWTPTLGTLEINVAMIGGDAYYTACRSKKAQVFDIFM